MTENEMIELLRRPFDLADLEWRIGSLSRDRTKARVLCYFDARAARKRLNDVCGPWGWQITYPIADGKVFMARLALRNPETGEWMIKEDGSDSSDMEAVKGGISGAFKRACSAWGIAEYLYEIPSYWVDVKPCSGYTPEDGWQRFEQGPGNDKFVGQFKVPALPKKFQSKGAEPPKMIESGKSEPASTKRIEPPDPVWVMPQDTSKRVEILRQHGQLADNLEAINLWTKLPVPEREANWRVLWGRIFPEKQPEATHSS